jgi:hypothetical protein
MDERRRTRPIPPPALADLALIAELHLEQLHEHLRVVRQDLEVIRDAQIRRDLARVLSGHELPIRRVGTLR